MTTASVPAVAVTTRHGRGTANTQAALTPATTTVDPEAKLSSPMYIRPTAGLKKSSLTMAAAEGATRQARARQWSRVPLNQATTAAAADPTRRAPGVPNTVTARKKEELVSDTDHDEAEVVDRVGPGTDVHVRGDHCSDHQRGEADGHLTPWPRHSC